MKRPACVVGCCLLLFMGLLFYLKPPEIQRSYPVSSGQVVMYGIVDDKYQKDQSTYLIAVKAGTVSGIKSEKDHKIIIKLKEKKESLAMTAGIGEKVKVTGKVYIFPEARNPGNFDLARYELIRGIDFELYDAAIEVCPGGRLRYIDEALCLIRERLIRSIDRIYDEEDAGVIKAMLLGDRAGLSDEVRSGYRRAGISHILCISALHITLLGTGLLRLLRGAGVNKVISYIVSFAVISMYGRLTGSGVSTVRALITFGLMMAADLLGRTPDLLSSMSVAGGMIIIARPLYVLDAGFILSFSAVGGIGILGPPLGRLISAKGRIFDSIRSSLSVAIFMLPVILYFFYQVPVLSTVINLLVIPLLTILLISSLLSMLLGCISFIFGVLAGYPAKLILFIYRAVTALNDRIPYSLITTGRPGIWKIVIYYLVLAAVIFVVNKRQRAGLRLRVCCGAAFFFAVAFLSLHIRPDLAVTMLDVGQGDCHLMETRHGKTVMIDCGSSDVSEPVKYRVAPYVLSRGHDHIDYAIVTHSDLDHVGGYMEMLEKGREAGIGVGCLIMPDVSLRDENYMKLTDLARLRGVEVKTIKTGDVFHIDGVSFECLNPEKGAVFSDVNASSVCLSVSLDGSDFKALYTGDVQDEGERAMMRILDDRRRYALLKCAHHGSKNSTPDELLDTISPLYTFISAGIDNQYGHPHTELMDRLHAAGTRIYVTNETGAVRMDTDGRRIRVSGFLRRQV